MSSKKQFAKLKSSGKRGNPLGKETNAKKIDRVKEVTISESPPTSRHEDENDPFSSLLRDATSSRKDSKRFRSLSRSNSPERLQKSTIKDVGDSEDVVMGRAFSSVSPEPEDSNGSLDKEIEEILTRAPSPTTKKPSKYSLDDDYNPEEDFGVASDKDEDYQLPAPRVKGQKRKKPIVKRKAPTKRRKRKKGKRNEEDKDLPWENNIKYCIRNFGYVPPPKEPSPPPERTEPKTGGTVRACITILKGRKVNVVLTRNHITFMCTKSSKRQRFYMGNLFRVELNESELCLFFLHTKRRLFPLRFTPLRTENATKEDAAKVLHNDLDAIMKFREEGIWVKFFMGKHFSHPEALSLHFYLVNLELLTLRDLRDYGLAIETNFSDLDAAIKLVQETTPQCDSYDDLLARDEVKQLQDSSSAMDKKEEANPQTRRQRNERENVQNSQDVDDEKQAEMSEEEVDQAQDKKESSGDVVPYKQPGGLSFLIYDPKYAPKAPGSTNQAHHSKSNVDETKFQKKETKKALERARKIMKMKFELRSKTANPKFKDKKRFDQTVPLDRAKKKRRRRKKKFLPRSHLRGPLRETVPVKIGDRRKAREVWEKGLKKLTWTKGRWHINEMTKHSDIYMEDNERPWGKWILSKEERLKRIESLIPPNYTSKKREKSPSLTPERSSSSESEFMSKREIVKGLKRELKIEKKKRLKGEDVGHDPIPLKYKKKLELLRTRVLATLQAFDSKTAESAGNVKI